MFERVSAIASGINTTKPQIAKAPLLAANGHGYWETSEENRDRLRELYQEVEDRIEGIE